MRLVISAQLGQRVVAFIANLDGAAQQQDLASGLGHARLRERRAGVDQPQPWELRRQQRAYGMWQCAKLDPQRRGAVGQAGLCERLADARQKAGLRVDLLEAVECVESQQRAQARMFARGRCAAVRHDQTAVRRGAATQRQRYAIGEVGARADRHRYLVAADIGHIGQRRQ
jgi:hypothetical protein